MIRPFLTSVRCLKGLGQKGSQEPNDEDLEKMKKASLGISLQFAKFEHDCAIFDFFRVTKFLVQIATNKQTQKRTKTWYAFPTILV